MADDGYEREEGEIVEKEGTKSMQETNRDDGMQTNSELTPEESTVPEAPPARTEVNSGEEESHREHNHGDDIPRKTNEETNGNSKTITDNGNIPPTMNSIECGGVNQTLPVSPISNTNRMVNGLHMGCFGPFPSPVLSEAQTQGVVGSLGKRKRMESTEPIFPINNITPMASLFDEIQDAHLFNLNTRQLIGSSISTPDSPSLDLKRVADGQGSEPSNSECPSSSLEAGKTAEIDQELGFEIESGNPVLQESLHSHASTDSIDDLCNIHRPTISSTITPPSSASSHQAGVNMVAELIGVTLGPRSRNVVLQNKYFLP
ncbi:unnamed protein product [Lactuca virosa]|uniref:Uncharacterized protein n=1 Tax=Lactuca virosa TaxID=75947 RepID=A0AAU9M6N8_9ASTR|nr:unnamed protein product [Lactuca virosa]